MIVKISKRAVIFGRSGSRAWGGVTGRNRDKARVKDSSTETLHGES